MKNFKKLGLVKELARFFMNRKRWWLIPIVIFLLLFGTLIILTESSAVVPFVYALF